MADIAKGLAVGYCEKRFGGSTKIVDGKAAVVVGTSPTMILPNDPDRIAYLVVNRDAAAVGVAFGSYVNLTDFLTLAASGGQFSPPIDQYGELVTNEVWAISALGGAKVYVLQVRRV